MPSIEDEFYDRDPLPSTIEVGTPNFSERLRALFAAYKQVCEVEDLTAEQRKSLDRIHAELISLLHTPENSVKEDTSYKPSDSICEHLFDSLK